MMNTMMNTKTISHVGYIDFNPRIRSFFSPQTVKYISSKVTGMLRGIYPAGIIIPRERIIEVMNDVYRGFKPPIGDIYTRYIIPQGSKEPADYIERLINEVISVIVSDVTNNLLTEQRNSRLDIWATVYGDNNKWGLRRHPPIHIRENKPPSMLFNMNY